MLIGVEHILGVHTGRNIAQIVDRVHVQFCLVGWLLAITTDNASNNNTLRRTLEQIFHGTMLPGTQMQCESVVWPMFCIFQLKCFCLA